MGDADPPGDGVELLCYFLHRYLDFRVPEVSSLAELAGAGGQIAWWVASARRMSLQLRRLRPLQRQRPALRVTRRAADAAVLRTGARPTAATRTRRSGGCACPTLALRRR